MMRYLPFIIISLILYTLFFYYNQEPELLSVKEDLSAQTIKQKVIPLDLTIAAELEQQAVLEKQQLASMPTIASVAKEVPVIPKVITAISSTAAPTIEKSSITSTEKSLPVVESPKKNSEKTKHFQASIKSTAASDVALIKGEFFERDFHLDLPPPPTKKKTTAVKSSAIQKPATAKKTQAKNTPVSSVSQQKSKAKTKQVANVETGTESEKQKRVFKKQIKAQQPSALPGLQVAIAVSGNKPTYPQAAKASNLQGTVSAKFIVNMQGKTKNMQIVNSSGHKILDDALLEFIAKERFMPALKGIEKVTSEQQFTFKYQ
ncbi:hypothetical protein GCM10007916_07560 [Psychromonas marina]|uniref:Protein TonB n=1 Tax=Psychromonas marina TaxID=88364 RepID=A0ABQ6DX05_9GAMM|nr:energy transducer TonB [Psychromonas marina]GLS89689.1 hypothetical protein GCM10007916_07560 [Psychromonas marina]